jgi:hypothetical protein
MARDGHRIETPYGEFIYFTRGDGSCLCCGTPVYGPNMCDECANGKCDPETAWHCFLDVPDSPDVCHWCSPHGGEAPCDGSCSYLGECQGYASAEAYRMAHEPHMQPGYDPTTSK